MQYLFITILTILFSNWCEVESQLIPVKYSQIDIRVFLEGPYQEKEGVMSTSLRHKGYLPGMKSKVFLAAEMPAEDPYISIAKQHKSNTNKLRITENYPVQAVDWVLVQITDLEGKIEIALTALLLNDGRLDFSNQEEKLIKIKPNTKYSISIIHRNHQTISTSEPILFEQSLSWDTTVSAPKYAKKLKGGIYAMKAGKLSHQGDKVSLADLDIWKKQNGLNSSYLLSDLDLNGDVNMADQEILLNNLRIDQGY